MKTADCLGGNCCVRAFKVLWQDACEVLIMII